MKDCGTCWGTGFYHGHGGPCMEGCPVPAEKVRLHVDIDAQDFIEGVEAFAGAIYIPLSGDRVEMKLGASNAKYCGTVVACDGLTLDLVFDDSSTRVFDLKFWSARKMPMFTSANLADWRWFELTTRSGRIEAQILSIFPDGSRIDVIDQHGYQCTLYVSDIADSGLLP